MLNDDASCPQVRVAIVANVLTPYRVHFHRRLQREIPDISLLTIVTHGSPSLPWRDDRTGLDIDELFLADGTSQRVPVHRHIAVIRRALRLIRHRGVDVVVVNGYNDLTRLALIVILPAMGVKVLLAADSNVLGEQDKPAWLRLVKRLGLGVLQRRLSGILAMGSCGRGYYEKYMSSPPPIFDVPIDVDVERFLPLEPGGRSEAIETVDLDPQRRRLLFVGRLTPLKGVEVLLEAFTRISGDRPDWDLVIAGQGYLEERLRRGIRPELKERVIWKGFVDHDRLPALYAACDAFVLPSLHEPWGIVVSEALASGLPVVASEMSGAAAEIVGRYGGGVLVSPADAGRLASALQVVTEPNALAELRRDASEAFRRWRQVSDPVEGFRSALRRDGLVE